MSIKPNTWPAMGACEACGGPCAVFGCRYCQACYWPAQLAELRADPASAAEHVAAFRRRHLGEPFAIEKSPPPEVATDCA